MSILILTTAELVNYVTNKHILPLNFVALFLVDFRKPVATARIHARARKYQYLYEKGLLNGSTAVLF
jgi:hypothetical protein